MLGLPGASYVNLVFTLELFMKQMERVDLLDTKVCFQTICDRETTGKWRQRLPQI